MKGKEGKGRLSHLPLGLQVSKFLSAAEPSVNHVGVRKTSGSTSIKCKMGNSDSQYNLQGTKGNNTEGKSTPVSRQKTCALKIRSVHVKDEKSRSSFGWGHGGNSISYKARSLGRNCLSQHKSNQRFSVNAASRQCEALVMSNSNAYGRCHLGHMHKHDCSSESKLLSGNNFPCILDKTDDQNKSLECNGSVLNGHGLPENVIQSKKPEGGYSPKVLIKTLGRFDGGLRVEFHSGAGNSSSKPTCEDSPGPVQLLRYSTAMESDPGKQNEVQIDTSKEYVMDQCLPLDEERLKSSKGSSLSSEYSWSESQWGHRVYANDFDNMYTTARAIETSNQESILPNDEQPFQKSSLYSLQAMYGDARVGHCIPTGNEFSLCNRNTAALNSNKLFENDFSKCMNVPSDEEDQGPLQYSSYTLPCRKPKHFSEDGSSRAALKSRMRRLSAWTGSLTRKKRKLQDSRSKDVNEYCDSGIDGVTADTSSPSQISSSLWSPGFSYTLPPRSNSTNAVGNDVLRQSIYENFMRELEMSHMSMDITDPSTGSEETSSDSFSSLEQLDLLFEKEQGCVRKAGWLSFKPLVTHQKERKLELAPRRKWRQYWVSLKGCTLLFYEANGKNFMEQSSVPRYALFAEDSIVQPVPEHPKKENVFCLSNAFGDVVLFQATSQTDLENWVTAIHSACASVFAKQHGKEDTVKLLKNETKSFMQKIDMDGKMKKMAELQLSIVNDPKNRKAIENQIQQWEHNLEKFNVDLFRMRCYLASLQGGELPNPKSLLAAASRPSKLALSRLGIFSVSSFHALNCSRDEATLRKRTLSLSQRIRSKKGIFSSLKGLDDLGRKGKEKGPPIMQHEFDGSLNVHFPASVWDCSSESTARVCFPDNQAAIIAIKADQTVEDVLIMACKMKQLNPVHYSIRLRRMVHKNMEYYIPNRLDYIQEQLFDEIEIITMNIYHMHLERQGSETAFGFAVAGQVDGKQQHNSLFVSDVLPGGLADKQGARVGDEILIINGEVVANLHHRCIESLFAENHLILTVRRFSSDWNQTATECNDSLNQITAPPPPDQSKLLEEFVDNHLLPVPSDFTSVPEVPAITRSVMTDCMESQYQAENTEALLKSAEQVSTFCRSLHELHPSDMAGQKESLDQPLRPLARHLSDAERLRKVIHELIDTEKSYVKDLSRLFEVYLDPLQNETFLTQDEMESLFGSLPEMLQFQKMFLQTLEDGIALSPDFNKLETPSQFKKLLFSLGGSFLYYADHFKLYSGFCANHRKAQKVLERAKTDKAFKEFLDARNPTKQHSFTLESYLIKPVQRVLKYPLLLKELVSLTDAESEEHYHLTETLKAMEKVASHINEMQKIYEDYGTVFDQLIAEQPGTRKEVTELSMGELLLYSTVTWLNPFPSLSRMRKDPELTVFVFRRAIILVYKEIYKLKKKTGTVPRSTCIYGDIDQFKFKWLIPLSALQVRLGNAAGTDTNCIWELIHTKSELEGRPETVFQLCSSDPESKTNIIKVIRSILRENVRRHMTKSEGPLEKLNREHLIPLRNRVPSSARIASTRALKLPKHTPSHWCQDSERRNAVDSDECSLSSGTLSSGCHTSESGLEHSSLSYTKQEHSAQEEHQEDEVKESDILSDEDDFCESKNETSTNEIEVQFEKMQIDTKAAMEQISSHQTHSEEVEQTDHPRLMRGHFCPIKRKSASTKKNKGNLLAMHKHNRSLDSQCDGPNIDLNSVLEREFSIQSLTSVVNEDCFYENIESNGEP
ncbi:rho guanine nucleotide exchange factor TIAM2 isoform X3 [Pristis pectinata]|uniref:rho guanine nucleotide exchange factor TIAM2 isoform X3 n=1 Tax=Pristis pectinata TaxID=685728 RepID=UPI00223E620C|nr:rho guanine nucleotide exchange factor TIAM2 isoform X3 [Pristis pectinata]